MKLLATVVIILSCCVSPVVLGSQLNKAADITQAYEQLSSLRETSSDLLKGGDGVFVVESDELSDFQSLDLILSINDQPIYSVADLYLKVALYEQDDDIFCVLLKRDGEMVNVAMAADDFSVILSDMAPGEVSQIIADTIAESGVQESSEANYATIDEYLKGRPSRTPNNTVTQIK